MGLKERMEQSKGGPDGQSTWGDEGDGFTLQNHASVTATTTANWLPMQTITQVDTQLAGGEAQTDVLTPGAAIQRLNGCQISFVTTAGAVYAASAVLTLAVGVYRNIGLGAALASGVPVTALTPAAPLLAPIPSGQTIALTNAAGNTTTATTSAAVTAGALNIPINSLTPANNYAAKTSYAALLVGGMPCFGWLYTAGGGFAGAAGQTGTPVLPQNASMAMPAIGSNTALVTPVGGTGSYMQVLPGDLCSVLLQTSAGSVILPLANLQPLLV